jgi:hypothetical protein
LGLATVIELLCLSLACTMRVALMVSAAWAEEMNALVTAVARRI